MNQFIRIIFLFLLTSIGCLPSSNEGKETAAYRTDQSEKLDAYFKALTGLKQFNGGVLLQKEGKILLHEVYNMRPDESSSLHVNKNAQFDIHSISKLMAKASVVNLVADNVMSREDKIEKYLPDFPNGESITIQHLLDNQAGFARGFSKEYPNLIEKNPAEVIELIKQEKLVYEPGSETMYSNLGYQLLYFIISKITKQAFVQYVDNEFFQPLEMNNSGAHFHLKKDNLRYLVKNHEMDDDEIVVLPNLEKTGKNQAKIYSNMTDLLKFIDHMKSDADYTAALKNKNNSIGWSGGGDGILCHASASLSSNYELVFFSNYDNIPFGDILETVEKIMTNQAYELPMKANRKAVDIERSTMEKYVGKYVVNEFNNDTFEFRIEKEKLVFYQNGERSTVLQAENERSFFDQSDSEDFFEFRSLENGEHRLIFHYKKVEIIGDRINN